MVLLILRALQGSPESGRLWEAHCNCILMAEPLNFTTTTHDKTIYTTVYMREHIFLLRQVDDFALACDEGGTPIEIYGIIGAKLRLPKEDKDPFEYLGPISDYNGINVEQTRTYIKISSSNYIDRIMTTHGWETSSKKNNKSTAIPLRTDFMNHLNWAEEGPKEGTQHHMELQGKIGFSYYTSVKN